MREEADHLQLQRGSRVSSPSRRGFRNPYLSALIFSGAETKTSGGLEVVLDVCLCVISAAPAVLPAVQAIRDRLGCCKLTEPNTGSMTSCSRPAPQQREECKRRSLTGWKPAANRTLLESETHLKDSWMDLAEPEGPHNHTPMFKNYISIWHVYIIYLLEVKKAN